MKLEYKWICPICSNVLKTRKELYKHQQELNHYKRVPTKEAQCAICYKIFKTKTALKQHIKEEKHYKIKNKYKWNCPFCNEIFKSRRKLQKHRDEIHNKQNLTTIINICYCQYCNREFKHLSSKSCHEKYCKLNPNHIIAKSLGRSLSEEVKQKLSLIQKERVKQGLNHGWMTSHSSKKSYPEVFFTKVIENEFNDKNYKYNFLFYQYRLDFAWPHKKLCIEIDGSQHQRNKKQKQSDIKKDIKLYENGWKILRIKWIDIYNDPQKYIKLAKEFIDNC